MVTVVEAATKGSAVGEGTEEAAATRTKGRGRERRRGQ